MTVKLNLSEQRRARLRLLCRDDEIWLREPTMKLVNSMRDDILNLCEDNRKLQFERARMKATQKRLQARVKQMKTYSKYRAEVLGTVSNRMSLIGNFVEDVDTHRIQKFFNQLRVSVKYWDRHRTKLGGHQHLNAQYAQEIEAEELAGSAEDPGPNDGSSV